MKKSISRQLLIMILLLSFVMTSLYAEAMSFTDVKESDWFYEDVKIAVEKGLVNGKTSTLYAPKDNLTYAETIKLAACMHQKHKEGSVTLKNGTPWYKSYADYCKTNKIISRDYDWGKPTTRAEYMDIFSRALPGSELAAVNPVSDDAIPDVPKTHKYAKEIYKLYKAGIVQGVDAARNCKPDTHITRAEVAAILTRMMDKTKRIKFDLSKPSDPTDPNKPSDNKEFKITKQPQDVDAKRGEKVKFSITAEGEGLTYQWQVFDGKNFIDLVDGAEVKGAKTSDIEITVPKIATSDIPGRCVVKDKNGKELISDTAKALLKTEILKQPEITAAVNGQTVFFELEAIGDGLSYQWMGKEKKGDDYQNIKDDANHKGTNSAKLEVRALTKGNEPEREYLKCVITDKNNNTVETKEVFVTKSPKPYIGDIGFVTDKTEDGIMKKVADLETQGKHVIYKDLNKGAKGDYIYLYYDQTLDKEFGITDIFVDIFDNVDDEARWEDRDHYGMSSWLKHTVDLNQNTPKGKHLYLYQTTDPGDFVNNNYRAELYDIDVYIGNNPEGDNPGWEVVKFFNSKENADLNKGAEGEFIYILIKRVINH